MGENDSRDAVLIARSILDGSMPLFLGCKQLVGPLSRLGVHHDEPFVVITGVDSELDEYPIQPHDRMNWNAQRLEAKDAEIAAWLPQVQVSVFEACREIVRRFSEAV